MASMKQKEKDRLRIIYMGTPQFAVSNLDTLIKSGQHIVAVVTASDKPSGRGKTLKYSAVKEYSLKKKIPVLQPENLQDDTFLKEIETYQADLFIVVAFRMLPQKLWRMPSIGTINLHASQLPKYRGAAPIHRAIMAGENMTGLTTFFIDEGIDTGNILLQNDLPIGQNETLGELYQKMEREGGKLLVKTIEAIEQKKLPSIPQKTLDTPSFAPKIFREDREIDWTKNIAIVHNLIRGLDPIPGAWTTLVDPNGKSLQLKLFGSTKKTARHAAPLGTVFFSQKHLEIAASGGFISPKFLQIQGKKRHSVEDFMRGYSWTDKQVLGRPEQTNNNLKPNAL